MNNKELEIARRAFEESRRWKESAGLTFEYIYKTFEDYAATLGEITQSPLPKAIELFFGRNEDGGHRQTTQREFARLMLAEMQTMIEALEQRIMQEVDKRIDGAIDHYINRFTNIEETQLEICEKMEQRIMARIAKAARANRMSVKAADGQYWGAVEGTGFAEDLEEGK